MLGTLLLLLTTLTQGASAEEFSITNSQLLYGSGFHDPYTGTDTESGRMSTLTLEHFGKWAYGFNYFFVDVYQGNFAGQDVKIYLEWEPQLCAPGAPFGPFSNICLAGQLARSGTGFQANLIGSDLYLEMGQGNLLGLGVFVRDDNFNSMTYQLTPFWYIPFHLGSVRMVFSGYSDFSGTDSLGIDVNAQPQLVVDLGTLLGFHEDRLQLGVEWLYHRNREISTRVLQGLVKWTW